MKKFVLTLMIVLFFLPIGALAEKLVFVTIDFPPLGFVENGQITGSAVETVQELCRRLGFECEIQMLPWKRALKYVKNGEADAIFGARHSEERAGFLYYPSESDPLNFGKTVIMALKGSSIKVNGPDDLKDKSVGVVRGYVYDPKFDSLQGVKRTVCNNDEQVAKMLIGKRFSLAMAADETSMKYFCKKVGAEVETLYTLKKVACYIAFSRKALGERGQSLAERFGQALRRLKEEGVVRKIESKYF